MATEKQITSVIKKQLADFNSGGVEINEDTVISSALKNKKRAEDLFKANIIWTLDMNKHKPSQGGKNKMPGVWKALTIKELASKLFLFVFILISSVSSAQLSLSVGAVKTDMKTSAINFAFSYIRSMDSVVNQDFQFNGKNSYFLITPDIKVQSGTNDAFSSLTAKATGLFTSFKTTNVDGLITPNASRTMHVFPVSIGAETNNEFTFVNGIVEAGYEPYWQSPLHKGSKVLQHLNWGVFLQAGHKWYTKYDTTKLSGGDADESKEVSGILRAKSNLTINTDRLFDLKGFGLGLVGDGGLWYDILNKSWYYRVNGTARIYLSGGAYFDVFYQKGSGAPNFNQGDQFGAGLTVNF